MRDAGEEVGPRREWMGWPHVEIVDFQVVYHKPDVFAIALGYKEALCAESRGLGSFGFIYDVLILQVSDEFLCALPVVKGCLDGCTVDLWGDRPN